MPSITGLIKYFALSSLVPISGLTDTRPPLAVGSEEARALEHLGPWGGITPGELMTRATEGCPSDAARSSIISETDARHPAAGDGEPYMTVWLHEASDTDPPLVYQLSCLKTAITDQLTRLRPRDWDIVISPGRPGENPILPRTVDYINGFTNWLQQTHPHITVVLWFWKDSSPFASGVVYNLARDLDPGNTLLVKIHELSKTANDIVNLNAKRTSGPILSARETPHRRDKGYIYVEIGPVNKPNGTDHNATSGLPAPAPEDSVALDPLAWSDVSYAGPPIGAARAAFSLLIMVPLVHTV
jgi:hypothetical protein